MINLQFIGKKYGKLTILNMYRESNRTYSDCKCDCGKNKKIVFYSVKSGKTTSCGCYNKEVISKHGKYGTKEYRAWQHMLRRCDDPKNKYSHLYYSKGIRVCEAWKVFLNFLNDMGDAPSPTHSIDRLDNNKGYEKSNCRWATKTEQSRNTNRNRLIEYKGVILCMSEWAEKYNLKYPILIKRLKMGWSIEKSLTTPVQIRYQNLTPATIRGGGG